MQSFVPGSFCSASFVRSGHAGAGASVLTAVLNQGQYWETFSIVAAWGWLLLASHVEATGAAKHSVMCRTFLPALTFPAQIFTVLQLKNAAV